MIEKEKKREPPSNPALIFFSRVGLKRKGLPCPTPSPGDLPGWAGKHSLPASDYKMHYVTWGMLQILFMGKEVILEATRRAKSRLELEDAQGRLKKRCSP